MCDSEPWSATGDHVSVRTMFNPLGDESDSVLALREGKIDRDSKDYAASAVRHAIGWLKIRT